MYNFSTVFQRFMKNQSIKKIYKVAFVIIFGCFLYVDSYSKENNSHLPPVQIVGNNFENASTELLPMPIGDVEAAAAKVTFERNPFDEPSKAEYPISSNLNSNLQFKGLVQSNNIVRAIIKTEDGQKFYGVGDKLSNGFSIIAISLEETTVDLSNGSKKFRLTLSSLKSSL